MIFFFFSERKKGNEKTHGLESVVYVPEGSGEHSPVGLSLKNTDTSIFFFFFLERIVTQYCVSFYYYYFFLSRKCAENPVPEASLVMLLWTGLYFPCSIDRYLDKAREKKEVFSRKHQKGWEHI